MANRFARKSGNWTATDVWSDTPSGAAGAEFIPGPGDVAMANSFTVTVNVDKTCTAIRSDTTGGATNGGGFKLSNGVTLTADCYAGSTNVVYYSDPSPTFVSVIGNVYGGTQSGSVGAYNFTTGTFTITGDVTAGTASTCYGAVNNTSGTLVINGNVIGSTLSSPSGAVNQDSGTLTINGDVIAGAKGSGVYVFGGSVTTISGDVFGGGTSTNGFVHGVLGSTICGQITVSGTVWPGAGPNGAPGITNYSPTHTAIIGSVSFDETHYNAPYAGRVALATPLPSPLTWTVRDEDGVSTTIEATTCLPMYDGFFGNDPFTMSLVDTDTLAGQDVSSPLNVYTYTAAASVEVLFEVFVSGVVGDGNYLLMAQKQLGGAGTWYQSPTESAYLPTEAVTVVLTTKPISVEIGDVVKVYFQGQAGDTSVPVVVSVYDTSVDKEGYSLISDYDPAKAAASQASVDALNDFDPASDVVAHVTLVDTTTTLTNSPDLSIVTDAIAALNDFDPASDVVAHVTLVDTTTTLTNAPDLSTVEADLDTLQACCEALTERIEYQVPEGPVNVIPAPEYASQTVAWCVCYDQNGQLEPGVHIYVRVKSGGTDPNFYDGRVARGTSNADGLAFAIIPRDISLTFEAKRGNGAWVEFGGNGSESLELPSAIGSP